MASGALTMISFTLGSAIRRSSGPRPTASSSTSASSASWSRFAYCSGASCSSSTSTSRASARSCAVLSWRMSLRRRSMVWSSRLCSTRRASSARRACSVASESITRCTRAGTALRPSALEWSGLPRSRARADDPESVPGDRDFVSFGERRELHDALAVDPGAADAAQVHQLAAALDAMDLGVRACDAPAGEFDVGAAAPADAAGELLDA